MNILRKRDVAAKIHLSIQCIDQWVKDNRFPKPFRIGPQVSVWDEADVDAWLELKKQGESDGSTNSSKAESLCTA